MTTRILSLDETMQVLRADRRRVLVDTIPPGHAADLDDLASDIATTLDADERTIRRYLRHTDAPLLERHGVVEYDVDERTLKALAPILECQRTLHDIKHSTQRGRN